MFWVHTAALELHEKKAEWNWRSLNANQMGESVFGGWRSAPTGLAWGTPRALWFNGCRGLTEGESSPRPRFRDCKIALAALAD